MGKTATIYSTRDSYVQAGIRFSKKPTSYLVVDDILGEDTAAAKLRHSKRQITQKELAGIQAMIKRAQEHDIEPALAIHDSQFEESEAERRLAEHREELAAMRRARRDLEQAIAALQIERDAAISALEEQRLELSRAQDQLQAAQAKIKEAEDGLGTIEALSAEVAEFKQAARAAKRKK